MSKSRRKPDATDQQAGREAVPEGGTEGAAQTMVVAAEITADAVSHATGAPRTDGGKPAGEPDQGAALPDAAVAVGQETTETEVSDGKEDRQGDATGEHGPAPGQRDPDGQAPAEDTAPGDPDWITGLQFGKDSMIVCTGHGEKLLVLYDEIDFLAEADPMAIRTFDLARADGIVWPKIEATNDHGGPATLTLAEIYALGKARPIGEEHSHEPAAGEDDETANHAADALGYMMMGIDKPIPAHRTDVNVLAALSAASIAYGTDDQDASPMPRLDVSWLTGADDRPAGPAAEAAATYLRAHPGAAPETLQIHLRRQSFAVPAVVMADGLSTRTAVAWQVFAQVLSLLDRLDLDVAARMDRLKVESTPRGPAARPRDELTFAPPDTNPLTQIGRRLQR